MDISELYTRACFRFYREEEQSGAYDTYAISRIFNYQEDDWNILLLDSSIEGQKVFGTMEDLYQEYFDSGNYKSILEVPFVEYNKTVLRSIKRGRSWQYDEIMPEVKITKVKMTAYQTSDGETFVTEDDAMKHEELLVSTHYFRLHHSPDLNETGRMGKTAILKVVEPSKLSAIRLAEQWCYSNIGKKEAYIQGITKTANWSFKKVDKSEINKNERIHHVN